MLIQVYVHTRKYCSQNTTTLETRSHVQYDTIRKDHTRWQIRHREELAGEGSNSHENALQRERATMLWNGGTKAEPAAARAGPRAARKEKGLV